MPMLEDALSNVRVLGEIAVGDSVPAIEAYSTSLLYRADFDTNFQDRNSFIMGNAKFNEEAVVQANLNTLLDEGEQYAVMMYTWRCCSRAQPIPATDQFDKIDVYQKIIDVYEPEITKLKNFYYFVNKATERFITEIKRMCRKDFVSEVYLWTLGRFINMFAVLDALKNAKASIKNDHAAYRRANQILKKMNDSQMIHESQNLTLFLADNDKISKSLQTKLEHINGAEDLLADVVSACCNMYENKHFVLPKEKEILLKVMVFGLYLLDGMNIPVYKLEEKKKLNLVKIDKFIKSVQVVPIFGDMQIELPTYIKKLKCFQENSSRWTCTQGGNVCAQSSILDKIASMRVQHHALMVELSKIKNESPLTEYYAAEKADLRNRDIYLAALHCLRCVAAWNSVVSEVLSWKLVNPVRDKPKVHEDMDTDYALVTKYNYSPEECTAIVEAISMIKSMQKLMLEMEGMLSEAVKSHTYYELQNFVQLTLREPIRQAVKKKRPNLQQHLQAIRDCCADWNDKRPPVDDPALKGEKDPKSGYTITLPRKSVGPSSTQLYMVRTMIESSLSERGAGGTKKKDCLRKELEGSCVQAIEQFHLHSYFWSYMLNFNQSMFDACDLSQLWFREFYLEMAMGKHIQFPIDMSMPWILANHIITSEDCSAMLEHVLVPFDLYNDSGTYALTKFKKQFLYDEIEAELNLCFDQLIVTLSEKIYGHYKVMASSLLLDKKFRAEKSKLGQDLPFPAAIRYDTILCQRHVQLLGRSVDLSRVIAQRIIVLFHQSLIVAIRKFTSRDLHGLIELDTLLEVNRLCHKLLSEQILLPNFEDLVKEANNNIVAPYGIITLHVFNEVNNCLLPGYCFNFSTQRFTKQVVSAAGHRIGDQATKHRDTPLSHVELFHLYGSTSLNRAFNQISELYTSFIGSEHLKIMCNMLGYQGIAVLIEEIGKEVTSKLTPTDNATSNHLVNQAIRLSKVMPYENKISPLQYRVESALQYYIQNQYNLFHNGDRVALMHSLNQLGNAVQFVQLLEQNLSLEEVEDLIQASLFQMNIPKQYVRPGDSKEEKRKRAEIKYKTHHAVSVIESCCTETEVSIVRESDLLTKERLCCGLSVFDTFLKRIGQVLSAETFWQGRQDKIVVEIHETSEFHRLWSGMQLCFCIPPPPVYKQSYNYLSVDIIGDGVILGACTLIALLGQQRRFEALDMCFTMLDCCECDDTPVADSLTLSNSNESINLIDFLNRAASFKQLHAQMFNMLSRYLTVSADTSASGANAGSSENVKNVNVYGVAPTTTSSRW